MVKVSRAAAACVLLVAAAAVLTTANPSERALLARLGMVRRPARPAVTVPPFMLDLWRRSQRSGPLRDSLDSVTAFPHEGPEDLPEDHVWFDLRSLKTEVNEAELRVPLPRTTDTAKHQVQVFEVIRPASEKNPEPLLRLLDSRRAAGGEEASLDVMPALARWRSNPAANHGLLVRTLPHGGRSRRSVSSTPNFHRNQTHLVTYSHQPAGGGRKRRGSGRNKHRRNRNKTCRRHRMYVDFNDVGWNNWIVAPPGYDAYYCLGECKYPLPDHLNTTNHAIVQTLVNSLNPTAVPRACCVPTELSSISMLYINEYEKVVLKNYHEMVVEGCGCR